MKRLFFAFLVLAFLLAAGSGYAAKVVIPKGSVVLCGNCGAYVDEFLRNVYQGERIGISSDYRCWRCGARGVLVGQPGQSECITCHCKISGGRHG